MSVINEVADLTLEGDVAVLTIDSPPVNALSAKVRDGLHDGFVAAIADPAATAIVLICGGRFDPIATPAQVNALVELLRGRNVEVEVRMQESGHELTNADVEAARDWLAASAIA